MRFGAREKERVDEKIENYKQIENRGAPSNDFHVYSNFIHLMRCPARKCFHSRKIEPKTAPDVYMKMLKT
jgi:hypothetical protein